VAAIAVRVSRDVAEITRWAVVGGVQRLRVVAVVLVLIVEADLLSSSPVQDTRSMGLAWPGRRIRLR
jgi:hypothetical protein